MKKLQKKEVLIIGAGSVGLALGGFLSEVANVTVLCRRKEQAQLIQKQGVYVRGKLGNKHFKNIHAVSAYPQKKCDIVAIATKCHDTQESIKPFVKKIPKTAIVLSLQNGITNYPLIHTLLKNPVVETIIPIGFERLSDNSSDVTFVGGDLVFGDPKHIDKKIIDELCMLFKGAGVPARESKNFEGEQWKKFIFNTVFNPLSAILNLPNSEITSWSQKQIIKGLVSEAYVIMQKDGVHIDTLETAERYANDLFERQPHLGKHKSSMCQDINAKRSTEIDILNGEVVARGAQYQIPTLYHQMIVQRMHMLEGRANPSDRTTLKTQFLAWCAFPKKRPESLNT